MMKIYKNHEVMLIWISKNKTYNVNVLW